MRWVRLLGGIFAAVVCVALTVASLAFVAGGSASSQDDYSQRISELEERVTYLEATVAILEDQSTDESDNQTFLLSGELYVVGSEGEG